MLSTLRIENIAIIESAAIDFGNGLNVMSGETGAGKSIIIDALSAVLGERTSKELIRTGAEKAQVSALFENISPSVEKLMESMGIPTSEDKALNISRVIALDGRNSCKVNGNAVTVSMLKTLGKELISIHGQHDSQNLLNPECHYKYLDALAGNEDIYGDYLEKYVAYSNLYRKFKSLSQNEEEKQKRIEFLQHEIAEIENAGVRIGEYDELCDKRDLFRNSEKVIKGLRDALSILQDGDDTTGVVNAMYDASKAVEKSAAHYEPASKMASSMLEITYQLEEKKNEIEQTLFDLSFDPEKLSEIEERISFLFKLKGKYGESEEEILEYLQNSKDELETLVNLNLSQDEIIAKLEADKEILLEAAEKLSLSRKHAASEFEVHVKHELTFLDMPNVEIAVNFERTKLSPTGPDNIEFLISPNPGEALKPLAKIASGGELSRIMLAIQNVLSANDNVGTMIFDEIDTGVSGSAAEKIAKVLKSVGQKSQVICITHSAQVASYADNHFVVEKKVQNEKTYTYVTPLDRDGRIKEVARIIGGVNVTELQIKSALEMIESACI
ncbi:MAG: DNA repair protein RecN [Oscillospiraceae bacterium]|nr:DNA repair protein RecN [Candidatus Limimonas egerieequi]